MTDLEKLAVKAVEGDSQVANLRREVCTMGGCPEGAECFCDEIATLTARNRELMAQLEAQASLLRSPARALTAIIRIEEPTDNMDGG